MIRGGWLAALLLALAAPANAGIYSYIDADGNRVFTDRPTGQAAEQIELKPSNAMPALPPAAPPTAAPGPAATAAIRYQLQIVSPAEDETIRSNAGDLLVSASGDPAPLAGHGYQLLLDGEPLSTAGPQTHFELHNVNRGTHRLQLRVIDANGRELARSPARTFHLIRTSLAQRRMVNPCRKNDYGVRPECPLKDKPPEKRNIPFIPFL